MMGDCFVCGSQIENKTNLSETNTQAAYESAASSSSIPVISGASAALELSDNDEYPLFSRTYPSLASEIAAIDAFLNLFSTGNMKVCIIKRFLFDSYSKMISSFLFKMIPSFLFKMIPSYSK
jgi:hypothetical protein